MFVYDITREETFRNISNWLEFIEKYSDKDVEKMILGSKCDLENRREVSEDMGSNVRFIIYSYTCILNKRGISVRVVKNDKRRSLEYTIHDLIVRQIKYGQFLKGYSIPAN